MDAHVCNTFIDALTREAISVVPRPGSGNAAGNPVEDLLRQMYRGIASNATAAYALYAPFSAQRITNLGAVINRNDYPLDVSLALAAVIGHISEYASKPVSPHEVALLRLALGWDTQGQPQNLHALEVAMGQWAAFTMPQPLVTKDKYGQDHLFMATNWAQEFGNLADAVVTATTSYLTEKSRAHADATTILKNEFIGIMFFAVVAALPEALLAVGVSESAAADITTGTGLAVPVVQPFLPTTDNPSAPLIQNSDQQIQVLAHIFAGLLVAHHDVWIIGQRGLYGHMAGQADVNAIAAELGDQRPTRGAEDYHYDLTDQYGFDSKQLVRTTIFLPYIYCNQGNCTKS